MKRILPKLQTRLKRKWTIALCLAFLSAIAAISLPLCSLPTAGLFPPRAGNPTRSVYIIQHDWHTGLAWSQQGLVKIGPEAWRHAPYVEVGWGDRDFYYAGDKSIITMLKAFFLPTPSAIHVVGFAEPPAAYFKELHIWRLDLSEPGFTNLVSYALTTFSRDRKGDRLPPLPGNGQYGVSNFYAAVPQYGFWLTCNAWTANALNAAGVPACPSRVLLPLHLIDRVRDLGTQLN
jgi:uncharacterized protein (TIGR02117 family)